MNSWTEIFVSLQRCAAFSDAARILMLSTLPDHAHYLRNFHAGTGNWLTMEMNGLAAIALTWPEFREASAWLDYATGRMTEGHFQPGLPGRRADRVDQPLPPLCREQFRRFCAAARGGRAFRAGGVPRTARRDVELHGLFDAAQWLRPAEQ